MAGGVTFSLRAKISLLAVPVLGLGAFNLYELHGAAQSLDSYQRETQLQKVRYFAKTLSEQEVVREALAAPPLLLHRVRGELLRPVSAGRGGVTQIAPEFQLDGFDSEWRPLVSQVMRSANADIKVFLAEGETKLQMFIEVRDALTGVPPDAVQINYYDHWRQKYSVLLRLKPKIPLLQLEPKFVGEQEGRPVAGDIWSAVMRTGDAGFVIEAEGALQQVAATAELRIELISGQTRQIAFFGDELEFGLPIQSTANLGDALNDLGSGETRYWLTDRYGHIRASDQLTATAGATTTKTPGSRPLFLSRWINGVSLLLQRRLLQFTAEGDVLPHRESGRKLLELALNGATGAHSVARNNETRAVNASYPIVHGGQTIGTLLISDDSKSAFGADILLDILGPVFASLIITLGAVFLLLWLMIQTIVQRLGRLGHETNISVARYGNLRESYLQKEISTGDEIGTLVHNISDILSWLHQHNQFLERMPRTLRHEINNPLNIVSTSLQNLADEVPSAGTSKYMDSARRGVLRIGSIVQYLADAVSLEESLKSADREIIDIGSLIEKYIANCRQTHKGVQFECHVPRHPVYVEVSDYRIEQLMDKIIDNAVDFQTKGTSIRIQLTTLRNKAQIIVRNYGPKLPRHLENNLFASMVTERPEAQTSRLHFGLGLYVVRVIAEYHNGDVRVANLENEPGVSVTVSLPRVLVHKGAAKKGA